MKDKRVVQVKITEIPLRVRLHKPKVRELDLPYPVITLSSWATYLLKHSPKFILGGFNLDEPEKFTAMFADFWRKYQFVDGLHPVYQHFSPSDYGRIIPWALHGDEGRGLAKVPLLVCAFQFIIPKFGVEHTNMSGHSG